MIYLHLIDGEVILNFKKENSIKPIAKEEFDYIKNIRKLCKCDEKVSYDKEKGIYSIKKSQKTFPKIYNIDSLNTPYHVEKMKLEGVYTDFISYMDEKTVYDNQQREKEKAIQSAYKVALKENPNLTYDEFVANKPTTFIRRKRSLEIQEPVPSQALLEFKERYLG